MKKGIEVEGRLKGIETFFFDGTEIDQFIKNKENYKEKYPKVKAVYISYPSLLNDIRIKEISKDFFVTVETDKVDFIPDFIHHIMYTVKNDEIRNLRPQDSFKIHAEPNYVYSVPMESFICSVPEDFQEDKEI